MWMMFGLNGPAGLCVLWSVAVGTNIAHGLAKEGQRSARAHRICLVTATHRNAKVCTQFSEYFCL
jgi:hypothetical protein